MNTQDDGFYFRLLWGDSPIPPKTTKGRERAQPILLTLSNFAHLLLDNCAVGEAEFAPAAVEAALGEGEFSGFLFVYFYAPAWFLTYP